MHRLRDLNRHLDQTSNAIMKTSAPGFTFGILVSAFIGAVEARDDGRYSQSPLNHGLTASSPAKDRVVQMPMASLFRIRTGNRKTAIIAYASTANGSTFLMTQ
jgi:hypothetical protein